MSGPNFSTLLARIGERQDELLEARAPSEGLRKRLAELAAQRPEQAKARAGARSWRLGLALAACLCLASGSLLWLVKRDAPALTFTLGEPPTAGVLGELAQAPRDKQLSLAFSYGTSLVLEPEARARVVATNAYGAELIIEAGRANVSVVPRVGNDWSLRSGPFTIHVKGTQFDVAYDA